MCMSDSPAVPTAPPPPPPPQEEKQPEMAESRRKKANNANTAIEGGTLLTGPTGIAPSTLTTGGGSLLGG